MSGTDLVRILDEHDARALTAELRKAFQDAETTWAHALDLAKQAYDGGVWAALGFPTWDAYVKAEVNDGTMQLPREERVTMVAELSAAGMSTRAIAPVVGVSQMQVRRDVSTDAKPAMVTGIDGKNYPTPETPKARRESIINTARVVRRHLRTTGERLERIRKDDRYTPGTARKSSASCKEKSHTCAGC